MQFVFFIFFPSHQLIPKDQRKRIAIYTASYFHETIMTEGCKNSAGTQNIHIRNKDFVLMPAYFKEHWFLIILCYPRNINSDGYCVKEFPRIVILDSSITFLKAYRSTILHKFQLFVQNQIAHELGKSPSDINELPVDFVPVAQQTNDYDCGLFLLEFAEKFILDNFETNNDDHSNDDDDNNDDSIDCDKKRQQIRHLIEQLSIEKKTHCLD